MQIHDRALRPAWSGLMHDPPRPIFCLIVEDDPLVGLDLAEVLEADGYYVAGPFRSGREASRWLDRFTPDVAVVDFALADGLCRELVATLQARQIGFVIHSGSLRSQYPAGSSGNEVWIEKPTSIAAIATALQQLLALQKADRDATPPCCAATRVSIS